MTVTREKQTGIVAVALPVAEAFGYVTPEGERRWVPGWEPEYPDGSPSEELGTGFVTRMDGVECLWLISSFDRVRASATYARVTPGQHFGLVSVACEAAGTNATKIVVSYDMTSLSGSSTDALKPYGKAAFGSMMNEWQQLIDIHAKAHVE